MSYGVHMNSLSLTHTHTHTHTGRGRGHPLLQVLGIRRVKAGAGGCRMQGVPHSNLECFLQHTTPTVLCNLHSLHQAFPTEGTNDGEPRTDVCIPFFTMGELWRCFEEWSAYGAGVPLMLPCGDTIVQYYVPYLSALQIYSLQGGHALFSVNKGSCDESDWSDTCESRGTSSEISSDNEIDKLSPITMKQDQWVTASCVSSERLSSNLQEPTCDEVQEGDHQGHLIFEYFEKCSPYGRAPLKEKINELGAQCPLLLSLHSNELSSASWFSVAWYPIYRIPTGPTMEDLSTCFLTFHSLWTPFTLQGRVMWCNKMKRSQDYICTACDEIPLHVQDEYTSRSSKCGKVLELPAFGLASYKLKGPFWASAALDDKTRAVSLANCADAWLRQRRVQHPDFNFFISRHWEAI